jgi:hypothetical protein
MNPYYRLQSMALRIQLFLFTLIVLGASFTASISKAQDAGTTNPLKDWTVINGNAGTGGTITTNILHFFMYALMGVIVIFGVKSCIAAASSGQTQQLWPRIMATVLGLSIPFFVNWITSNTAN